MSELWITTHDGRTDRIALGNGELVIGRDPGCDLCLEDVGVSRRHAVIRPDADGYVVADLGSKNGTQVNGQTLPVARLSDGDVVVCGTRSMVYRQGATALSSTSVVLADRDGTERSTHYASARSEPVLPQQRLQVLYELSDRLTRLREPGELLDDAMNICFDMFRFERGAVAVRPPQGRNVEWPVIRNATGAEGELTISRTIVARALEQGERSVVVDAQTTGIDPTVSMVQHGIRSALCVPLEYQGQILGVIYGDRTSSSACYTDEDMDFLAGLAKQVSIGLVNSRLHDERRLKLQLESEIGLAREIQNQLFPAALPDNDAIHIAALNEPGHHVSGDYYDVIDLGGGRVGLLIADVTGKGVASSLLMANLQAAVRVTLESSRRLDDLLDQWNALIYRNTDAGKFVTCLVLILEPAERTATIGSAGHFLPYLVARDPSRSHELTVERGLPLGIDEVGGYCSRTVELGPDPCTLFAYTDGVVEAMNGNDELFGWDQTRDVLHQGAVLAPQPMLKRVRSAISSFCGPTPQSDDITMLAAHLP